MRKYLWAFFLCVRVAFPLAVALFHVLKLCVYLFFFGPDSSSGKSTASSLDHSIQSFKAGFEDSADNTQSVRSVPFLEL